MEQRLLSKSKGVPCLSVKYSFDYYNCSSNTCLYKDDKVESTCWEVREVKNTAVIAMRCHEIL